MYHKMGIKPCSMVWLYIHVYNCIWLLFCMLHCSIHILFHIFRGYFEIWIIWSQELFFFFFKIWNQAMPFFSLFFKQTFSSVRSILILPRWFHGFTCKTCSQIFTNTVMDSHFSNPPNCLWWLLCLTLI